MFGEEGSFWMETCPKTDFPSLDKDLNVDTVILGGGIAGITTASLLKDLSHKVVVLEANRIVKEVTVGTTAKINVAHSMIYSNLMKNVGESVAQTYAHSQYSSPKKNSRYCI